MDEAPHRPQLANEFRAHMLKQEHLCDRLESLADSLPDGLNVQESLYVAQSLLPILSTAHRFEEEMIFPLLPEIIKEHALPSTLERLGFEHMADEEYANDVTVALRAYVSERHAKGAETLAWMMRGFFESLRRHIAFERECILPLLEERIEA